VKNPNPVTRARRIEMRRKALGSDKPSCFYCGESDVACLEIEHPVGREYDKDFTRIVCRNCHRKLETGRDFAKLTKNGQYRAPETDHQSFRNYVLRVAHDLDATGESIRKRVALLDEINRAYQEENEFNS
jgi:hypothetical protein